MKTFRFPPSLGFALAAACALALAPHSAKADCSLTTTGNVPLPDLGARTYKGYTGGLYPDGSNVRPAAHETAGLAAAAQVQPLDRQVYRLFLSRIKAAKVTPSQVQVAWFECELEKPAASGNFPGECGDAAGLP